MRVSLIITAAGASTRFAKTIPKAGRKKTGSKLFFELGGIPVLERTLRAFSSISEIRETYVTVQPGFEREASAWGNARGFKKVKWIAGGKTRAESVLFALKKTSSKNSHVMVHDGARPFVAPAAVKKLFTKIKKYDGILLGRQVVATLKKVSLSGGRVEGTVDRSRLAEAETPQLVKRQVLLNAYRKVPGALSFTDESSLVEAAGGKMGILLHADWNPKLTHYADFELAEARVRFDLCAKSATGMDADASRMGIGYDIHRLVAGRKLWIGGIKIPFEKGSLGHSDGDALLHSITDAILGAMGLGDIGDWFSDRNPKYKNIQSSKLLAQVLERTKALGWRPSQVDTNVILEKPKLGPLKMKIRTSVAKLLNLPLTHVSVKARTYEGLAPIGTGEAWVSQAIVIMQKIKG